MGEYEVGGLYFKQDGTPVRFMGVNPDVKHPSNWEPVQADGGKKPFTKGDAGRMALQGLTANFADNIHDAFVPGTPSADRVEQIKRDHPFKAGASAVVGAAPWAAVPGGQGHVARTAIGAGIGGVFAAGDIQEGTGVVEGAKQVAGGAVAGGAGANVGAAIGAGIDKVAGAFARRAGGSAGRLARGLQDAVPNMSPTLREAIESAKANIQTVKAAVYGPLDKLGAIRDPDILAAIKEITETAGGSGLLPRDVRRGGLPTVKDLQTIRDRLRSARGRDPSWEEAYEQVNDLMKTKIPGMAAADDAFRQAVSREEAIQLGLKIVGKSADEQAVEISLLAPGVQQYAREALVHSRVNRLLTRGTAKSAVEDLIDAHPMNMRSLRNMFPDDQSADAFLRVLRAERSAARINRAFTQFGGKTIKFAAGAAALGSAAAGVAYGVAQAVGSAAGAPTP